MKKRTIITLFISGFLLIIFGVVVTVTDAKSPHPIPIIQQEQPGISNDSCLSCHGQPGQLVTLPSGIQLYISIYEDQYYQSVHGINGYACVQCHIDIGEYPHPPRTEQTFREYSLNQNELCARCHQDKFDKTADSVHQRALNVGNENAAVCTDCHGSHYVQPPDVPLSRKAQICEKCHSLIYKQYEDSVHGSALIGEGNLDVPSCTDCHGVHTIEGPTNYEFHLRSPEICAECHADEELMSKYGISTDVFSTYVADFHGTSVELFDQTAPDQQTNKPVCVDCHGVHNIKSPSDPDSTVMKDNLLSTCQKCHPDATSNFPTSWLGHYTPDPDNFPIVYFVELFYKIFIPLVLGVMLLFVITDAIRRLIDRRREPQHEQ